MSRTMQNVAEMKVLGAVTFHDTSLRDITPLAEPEGGVETLVHPLAVPLLQQASVLVSKVQRVELLHGEFLQANILLFQS